MAVVIAVIPNVASWATGQIDNVLNAAGTSATKVGSDALAKAGVVYDGLKSLGGGAILAGMVLGAIVAFVIDKRYYWAAGYCAAGAVLSFIGLIHGEQVAWAASPGVALGYLFAAVICLAFSFGTPAPAQMPDEHAPAAAKIPEPAQPVEVRLRTDAVTSIPECTAAEIYDWRRRHGGVPAGRRLRDTDVLTMDGCTAALRLPGPADRGPTDPGLGPLPQRLAIVSAHLSEVPGFGLTRRRGRQSQRQDDKN